MTTTTTTTTPRVTNIRKVLRDLSAVQTDRIAIVSAIRVLSRHQDMFPEEMLDRMTVLHEQYRDREFELRDQYDAAREFAEEVM